VFKLVELNSTISEIHIASKSKGFILDSQNYAYKELSEESEPEQLLSNHNITKKLCIENLNILLKYFLTLRQSLSIRSSLVLKCWMNRPILENICQLIRRETMRV
jgi:hypothetical protein